MRADCKSNYAFAKLYSFQTAGSSKQPTAQSCELAYGVAMNPRHPLHCSLPPFPLPQPWRKILKGTKYGADQAAARQMPLDP